MPRVKFKDLPRDKKITDEEMRLVKGGWLSARTTGSLLDSRAGIIDINTRTDRMRSFSKVDRFVLPNMMHDAGP